VGVFFWGIANAMAHIGSGVYGVRIPDGACSRKGRMMQSYVDMDRELNKFWQEKNQILVIERASFSSPWTKQDFEYSIEHNSALDIIHRNGVAGYLVATPTKHGWRIANMAVREDVRRQGIGNLLIQRLVNKMLPQMIVTAIASEWNMDAHLFFRACGLRAVEVKRSHFDNGDAAYCFKKEVFRQFCGKNYRDGAKE
jgi:ribosomal protein S18 acetylase RimI-like enzyme